MTIAERLEQLTADLRRYYEGEPMAAFPRRLAEWLLRRLAELGLPRGSVKLTRLEWQTKRAQELRASLDKLCPAVKRDESTRQLAGWLCARLAEIESHTAAAPVCENGE